MNIKLDSMLVIMFMVFIINLLSSNLTIYMIGKKLEINAQVTANKVNQFQSYREEFKRGLK